MSVTELMRVLEARFQENRQRHEELDWSEVQARLAGNRGKLRSLAAMEASGGEPDVIGRDETTGEYLFCDCSAQSPTGRRNICYDRDGQEERVKKGIFPEGNALEMAAEMGIELLNQKQYEELQTRGEFDTTTSSWVVTPEDIRDRGGALFGDYRYGHVFFYHNSARSFYSSRGFRGLLRV